MKKIVLFSLGFSIVLSACGKFRYDKDQSAEVNRKVETAFDEMTNISDQAITGNMVYYKNGGVIVTHPGDKPVQQKTACNVIITIDTIGSVKTVTVDYGSSNCDCNDGKTNGTWPTGYCLTARGDPNPTLTIVSTVVFDKV
ncbi:MAG: hypothetical protein RL293_1027, partial [Bacteroidota bacterium]